jgi:membrane-bound lytic murein transglycosylase A
VRSTWLAALLAATFAVASAFASDGAPVTIAHKYEPIDYTALPGWADDDHVAALQAFKLSCVRVGADDRTHSLSRVCGASERLSAQSDARRFFETNFAPHRVKHNGPAGLLTGYYEPSLRGSRTPTDKFKWPIYRRPSDLVNIVPEAQRGTVGSSLTHGRQTATGIEPYATRTEIEQGALSGEGLELAYLADPVDLFFMQVQGSGRIVLPDGSSMRVSYDGKNGHPYTSIGRYLVDSGQISADRMTLGALGSWLREDEARGREVMRQNKSYVFFRALSGAEAESPLGVLDIPLTPGRSLAVDTSFHAIGTPIYVVSETLTHAPSHDGKAGQPFRRLMIAQDVGSAIKGPQRGDIFFGSGDMAGDLAGITKHAGIFYVLLPREAALQP